MKITQEQLTYIKEHAQKFDILNSFLDQYKRKGELSEKQIAVIDKFITRSQDFKGTEQPTIHPEVTIGVYEMENGDIFIVKPNQTKTRMYAKKLVGINGKRLTEAGTVEKIEFEYVQGAILKLKPEHRMEEAKAREITILYGCCIVCGRALKDATSVSQGIGPVCRKYFAA